MKRGKKTLSKLIVKNPLQAQKETNRCQNGSRHVMQHLPIEPPVGRGGECVKWSAGQTKRRFVCRMGRVAFRGQVSGHSRGPKEQGRTVNRNFPMRSPLNPKTTHSPQPTAAATPSPISSANWTEVRVGGGGGGKKERGGAVVFASSMWENTNYYEKTRECTKQNRERNLATVAPTHPPKGERKHTKIKFSVKGRGVNSISK